MENRKGFLTIALVSVALGLMLAIQFKVTQGNTEDYNVRRTQDVMTELNQVKTERDDLKTDLDELRLNMDKLISGQNESMETYLNELNRARQAAGLEAVKGPGIVVTLNDSTRTAQSGEDPNLYLIHDEDLLKVVNELKAAGAEAISVNGHRILAMSEVRCAGPTILINGNRIAPPFEVMAIGDPATLENSLRMKGGILENLTFWGIQASIDKPKEVAIPSYTGTIVLKYAVPVKEG